MGELKKRKKYIDLARGIAMLLVIFGHCALTPKIFVGWLYSFHMPLFFVISGMVFNYEKYDKFSSFLISRVKSLLIPYFMFNLIVLLYRSITEHATLKQIAEWLLGIVIGDRSTDYYFSLWFFTALFVAEICIYFIIKSSKGKRLPIFAALVVFSVIGYLLLENLKFHTVWSIENVPVAITFLLAGYLIANSGEKIYEKIFAPLMILPAAVLNVVCSFFNSKICGISDIFHANLGNYFLYYIAAFSGIVGVVSGCKLLEKITEHLHLKYSFLEFVGRNTVAFYSLHNLMVLPFAMALLAKISNKVNILNNQYLGLLFVMAFTIVVLAAASELTNRFLPFLLGKGYGKIKNTATNKTSS